MSTDSAWDSTRWRDSEQYRLDDDSEPSKPPFSTSAIRDSRLGASTGYSREGHITEHRHTHERPASAENLRGASAYPLPSDHGRHSPPSDGHYGPKKLTTLPEHDSPWQSLRDHHDDTGQLAYERRGNTSPLTLHIPRSRELPSVTTDHPTATSEAYTRNNDVLKLQQTQSLPSFASFQEHVERSNEIDESEMASTASRTTCYLCATLKSRVRDVAIAVAELDETVQAACNKTAGRSLEYPTESSYLTVQWILDRLRFAKDDVGANARGLQSELVHHQTATSGTNVTFRTLSPTHSLKRSAERTFGEDELPFKRPRSSTLLDQRCTPNSTSATSYRRASIDFNTKDLSGRRAFSPPPTESVLSSAYPRISSPARFARLPSPSSMVYPPSAAPSLPPPTVYSAGSPTTSLQQPVSIHTASTDSVTSAHIAELQHQVTLKSLALQTLQSEYSSLLQKVQRLTVKTQTMERKSNVADREVNDLTGRNEDLLQQVQSLQEQLEEIERKREKERDDASREKDQWLLILDQSRRLQMQYGAERQALVEHINSVEAGTERHGAQEELEAPRHLPVQTIPAPPRSLTASSIATSPSKNRDSSEIIDLKAKIESFRHALEEAKQQNMLLEERAKDVANRSGSLQRTINYALNEAPPVTSAQPGTPSRVSGEQPHEGPRSPHHARDLASSSRSWQFNQSDSSTALPTLTTPEEVIKALGPVPSAYSRGQDQASSHNAAVPRNEGINNQAYLHPKQRSSLAVASPWSAPVPKGSQHLDSVPQFGAFRPLVYPSTSTAPTAPALDTQAAAALQSPGSSPGSESDDSTSTLTKMWSAQSAEANTGPFGAELTPISTLPTPNSAISAQKGGIGDLSGGYFNRNQPPADKSKNSLAMPPPPRPTEQ